MKKILMIGIAAIATVVMAQEKTMSLADASAKVDAAAKDSATMSSIMKQLSADDQVAFLAKVNAAIDSFPGSPAEKAAAYLNANEAAMKSSRKGNLQKLLAETYATVPLEALTVINESFAKDLFNRANSNESEESYKNLALNTMKKIQARNAGSSDAGVRDTFAALMFIRGAGSDSAGIRDALVANLPDAQTRDLAKNEWIPPALGEGQEKTYDPMLGAGGSDAEAPSADVVLHIAGPQSPVSLVSDLASDGNTMEMAAADLNSGRNTLDYGMNRVPRTSDKELPWYGGYRRSDVKNLKDFDSGSGYSPQPEPHPYRWQSL